MKVYVINTITSRAESKVARVKFYDAAAIPEAIFALTRVSEKGVRKGGTYWFPANVDALKA